MNGITPALSILLMAAFLGSATAEVVIVQTGRTGDRHRVVEPDATHDAPDFSIKVNTTDTHQELAGFGASFTESSAWNLACLPEDRF